MTQSSILTTPVLFFFYIIAFLIGAYFLFFRGRTTNNAQQPQRRVRNIQRPKLRASIFVNHILVNEDFNLSQSAKELLNLLISKFELFLICKVESDEEEIRVISLFRSNGVFDLFPEHVFQI